MTVKTFSYSRSEKLKSRKLLNRLFQEGKSLNAFPLKLIYLCHEYNTESLIPSNAVSNNTVLHGSIENVKQVPTIVAGVGVSSRNFKKAVHRNRIKRLLRESFRLQKHALDGLSLTEKQWQIFFMYTGKEIPELIVIQTKMQWLMNKLIEQLTPLQEKKSPAP